ncbi:hypothetical protein G6F56_006856 [Rhizopus delemar]|nr:hypothetical protein G6F56_006856 [Rhizopus delemar]
MSPRDFIYQQLINENKKDQLASVVLLQFLYNKYIKQSEHVDLVSNLVPLLVKISEKYGEAPTLLSCSACELAMAGCGYMLDHRDEDKVIVQIEPVNIENITQHLIQLLNIVQKWHTSKDELSIIAYNEITMLMSAHMEPLALQLITTHLTPKLVLSNTPFSLQRLDSILCFQANKQSPLLSKTKLILILVLQSGYFGIYRDKELSKESEEIKCKFSEEFEQANTKNSILERLFIHLPFLLSIPPWPCFESYSCDSCRE